MDGYSYDAAGNLLNDNAGHSFTYDAENRVIQVGTNVFYVYDGDGRRIRKTISGTSTDFFYDLAGHEIAEMNSSGGWNRGEVFAGDRHIATYNLGDNLLQSSGLVGHRTITDCSVGCSQRDLPESAVRRWTIVFRKRNHAQSLHRQRTRCRDGSRLLRSEVLQLQPRPLALAGLERETRGNSL